MENLNALVGTGSPSTKVELITKIKEQVLNYEPGMRVLEEVIDDLLAFTIDVNQEVKRAVVGFIEDVCKQNIKFLPKTIKSLIMLLREDSAQVTKRVIQACGVIYKNLLQFIVSTEEPPDEIIDCFDQMCSIKTQILELIDNENDGIRTNSIKFLESVIIFQSYADSASPKKDNNDFSLDNIPESCYVLDRDRLEDEAKNIFEILLKFHGEKHITSVNLIACTGSLCQIAKTRPAYLGHVIEALRALYSNFPPTLTGSQQASVKKTLKMNFMSLVKQPSCYEFRPLIVPVLLELGASQNEINRALPKMDKREIQLRSSKRSLPAETSTSSVEAKKPKLEEPKLLQKLQAFKEEQSRATQVNESSLIEGFSNIDVVSYLVTSSMLKLPPQIPEHFLKNFQPLGNIATAQKVEKIAKLFSVQMTESNSKEEEKSGQSAEEFKKDETARKLRETLERMKAQPKLKQRIKTLKLQEIAKPLHRELKQKFMLDAVKRVLKCERHALISGMGLKRKKIITVFASTFNSAVGEIIMDYIQEDIVKRIDLAFMWIFEEYSLIQGFSRFTYVKSEHKHDYAYNQLFIGIVTRILQRGSEFRERESLIKRLYLEAPMITDEILNLLMKVSEHEDLIECAVVLVKDLLIRRPPKEAALLTMLLKFLLHGKAKARDAAIENILSVYSLHKILMEDIEEFSVKMMDFLKYETPPSNLVKILPMEDRDDFDDATIWSENLVKICMNLYTTLLPLNESLISNLSKVFIATPQDNKRLVLRSVEAPLKKMGMESRELLQLVDTCEKGAETLITKIIYVLLENTSPTSEFVEKVRNLYHTKITDVRILVPIVNFLSKKEIIAALPKFLKLNPQILKEVFTRLLNIKTESNVKPSGPNPSEI